MHFHLHWYSHWLSHCKKIHHKLLKISDHLEYENDQGIHSSAAEIYGGPANGKTIKDKQTMGRIMTNHKCKIKVMRFHRWCYVNL